MTSRELVIRTLNHQPVPRVPRDLWISQETETAQADDVAELLARFPGDIAPPELPGGGASRHRGELNGELDAWGCHWQLAADGSMLADNPPLAEASRIAAFKPPAETLEAAKAALAAKPVENNTRFLLARSDVRPFERFQALRGPKVAIVDLARGGKESRRLLAVIHEHHCRELELWAKSGVDGVVIRDHWGTADALLVAPAMWREIFRPLYQDYCRILHAADKFVFFQSGGNVADILADLVKIEVDAVHSQWSSMNVDRLAKRFRGKITFWGGLDTSDVLVHSGEAEVREAARRVRRAFDLGAGGVIAQCLWPAGTPIKRLVAFCEEWTAPMPMHAE